MFILRQLRDQERVPRGPLPNGRVETEDKLDVHVVHFGDGEYPVNGCKRYTVVRGFTEEPDGVHVEFERESATAH